MQISDNVNFTNLNKTFKGKYERTERGNLYYKSDSATKAGGVLAIFPFVIHTLDFFKKEIPKSAVNDAKDVKKLKDFYSGFGINAEELVENLETVQKRQKKIAIPFAIISSALTLGCGVLVDYLRNKRAKETSDKVRMLGVKRAMMQDDNIELSRRNAPYYHSSIGTKYGALLGALCSFAVLGKNMYVMSGIKSHNKILSAVPTIFMFALGGLFMGMIADHNTNKSADRH